MSSKIKVKKRNGTIKKFDEEKITSSIFKAAQRVGGKDRNLAEFLAKKVTNYLKKNFPKKKIVSSDEIGDAVEKVLIEEGHAKTAKTFILYREAQRKARKKLVKLRDMVKLREFLQLTEQKIVFVTGVYDLLHIGHARYLKKTSLQGDVLVVGLNSDDSAKSLKGEQRPILGEEVRAEMLSYLDFVDFIVIYPEVDAAKVVKILKPDVYVCVQGSWKGKFEEKPEVKEAKKCKSKIVVLPPQSLEISSTNIISKIKTGEKNSQDFQLVSAAIFYEEGKILLVKQKNRSYWTPPGGLVDVLEDPQKACIREVKEEVGLDVIPYGNFPPAFFKKKESQKNYLVLNFLVRRQKSQKVNLKTKENEIDEGAVEDYRWETLESLDKLPITPSLLPVLKELKKSERFQKAWRIKFKIKTTKKNLDVRFIRFCQKEAKKSTCWWRKVGCLVVKNGRVLLSAHNEIMPNSDFCRKAGCVREELGVLPGEKLELCAVIHAEANLISKAARKGISLNRATFYSTTFPCQICAKTIAQAGIKKLVFSGEYSNNEGLAYLKSRKVDVFRFSQK